MKFYFYTIILVGLMMLLSASGYDLTITGGLMNSLGFLDNDSPDASDFKNGSLWDELIIGILGFSIAGLVIGTFGRSPDINLLSASLVAILAGLITTDYLQIMAQLNSFDVIWIKWGMGILFSTLIVGFYISTLEFWRGTD